MMHTYGRTRFITRRGGRRELRGGWKGRRGGRGMRDKARSIPAKAWHGREPGGIRETGKKEPREPFARRVSRLLRRHTPITIIRKKSETRTYPAFTPLFPLRRSARSCEAGNWRDIVIAARVCVSISLSLTSPSPSRGRKNRCSQLADVRWFRHGSLACGAYNNFGWRITSYLIPTISVVR